MAHTTSFIVTLLTESTQLGTIIPKINWTVRTTTKISTVCTKKYTTGKKFQAVASNISFSEVAEADCQKLLGELG